LAGDSDINQVIYPAENPSQHSCFTKVIVTVGLAQASAKN